MNEQIRILILEDNVNDAELIKYQIKKLGNNVSCLVACTKSEYIEYLNEFLPDIILADYSLPSFDGLSAFYILQEKNRDIPFIIVSSSVGEENAVELIKLGVTDYVLKDKLYTLLPKIERALKEAKEIRDKNIAFNEIKRQNEKLLEIAFLQAHQLRAPLTNIQGLINLYNFNDPADSANAIIMEHMRSAITAFDEVIGQIVQKTSNIKE